MFKLFKRKPQPRVVSVRTPPEAAPLPANIDIPPFMRRTPAQESEIAALRQRGHSVLNRGILSCL